MFMWEAAELSFSSFDQEKKLKIGRYSSIILLAFAILFLSLVKKLLIRNVSELFSIVIMGSWQIFAFRLII